MIGVFFVVSIILFVLFNNVPGDRALNQVQNLRGKVSDETFQLRYQEAREKWGSAFRVGMGAESIQELLQAIDLDKEYEELQAGLKGATRQLC